MAQWRPLHRRITSSDKVVELAQDPFSLWLYCALLPHTDADGRINGNPAGLAGTIFEGFGYSPDEIERGLHALATVGLIVLYRNGRNQFLVQFTKFAEMCRPDKREARSELPGPSDEGSEVVTGSLPEPYPEPSGNLPEESAKNPRLHVHVHEQLHGDVHVQTRAQDARPAPAEKPKPKKQPRPAKPAKPKPPAFDALAVPLPDFVSHEAWTDFVEHRQQLKKPLTERAAELILKDLAKTPLEADRMLRRSVANGWTGVYARDDQRGSNGKTSSPALDQYKERGL